ncbi:Ribosomal lysine N-methyltransferase set11 [Paramyrothecium foliicola]|nr:Ribosomal lysine N-methyltransferase set11 [Paramyrothecium foliicola]
MPSLDDLVRWAEGKGVELSGVQPQTIPGRGVGMLATRDLEAGETIVFVPAEAHRSLHSIPKSTSRKLPPNTTIHAHLAADLALQWSNIPEWTAFMPSSADFEALPFLWPEELRNLLPSAVAAISARHHATFENDWHTFASSFPDRPNQNRAHYLHAFCVVATRSFYFETPTMLQYEWVDRLTLLPVADMFNHASTGCAVQFSTNGHRVITDRAYHEGEEICTSYGEHGNDYLLAEYGFLLEKNPWDTLCLDEVILPKLDAKQKKFLETELSSENFTLAAHGLESGSKLQAALQLLCSKPPATKATNGKQGLLSSKSKVEHEKLLLGLLIEMQKLSEDRLMKVQALQLGSDKQQDLLRQRWVQINSLASVAIKRSQGDS